jgi:aminoglycoside phosphotransferase (APT) family kinase protein
MSEDKRAEAIDAEALDVEALDVEALASWLEANVEGLQGPIRLTKFEGGQSNPTYRLDAASGSYALRRKPFGQLLKSAHAVDREFRVISALHNAGFTVPRPYALCEDEGVIGAMFYLMQLCEGEVHWDGRLPQKSPAQRRAIYLDLIGTLARLHAFEPEQVGLADYGRPGNYFARQIGRWSKQYRLAQTDQIPEVERLIAYLPETVPAQTRTSVIHGDFRIDNLIYGDSTVVAVLDWELSTLGDPLADLTYCLMQWTLPAEGGAGIEGLDYAQLGIPTLEEATAHYCQLSGVEAVTNLSWYFAYNLFRLVGIIQGVKKRMEQGNASSAKAAAVVARLPLLARAAWSHAMDAGAT